MALTGKKASDVKTDDEAVIGKLQELDDRMKEAVDSNGKFPEGLKNVFADFDEKLTSILYKYRQFHG